ncbi:MAG: hypothetical protein VKL60_16285 [Sphaerospermopsis sp.]|nr:hypothetical protein [Sphaerospermopsis sp.]
MTKGNNDTLLVEELVTILKKIGVLQLQLEVAKNLLTGKYAWLSSSELDFTSANLKAASSLICTLCAGVSNQPSSVFEPFLYQRVAEVFISLYDVKTALLEINANYFATKLAYSETYHTLDPLWNGITESLEKAKTEIENAIKSQKL